jgi:hypothetical protein
MKLEIPEGVIVESITFNQAEDSCSHRRQSLTLSLEDAGAGAFLVIRAPRWSHDSEQDDLTAFSKIGKQMCDAYDCVHHSKPEPKRK